jgi:hypothetical protein
MANLLLKIEIDADKYKNLLMQGKFQEFEDTFYAFLLEEVYDKTAKTLIQSVADSKFMSEKLSHLGTKERMGKCQNRMGRLQLRTGTYININTCYAKIAPKNTKGSRYLLFRYWGIIQNASPSYYSLVSIFSILCGSFEIAKQALDEQQIKNNLDRIRKLSIAVSNQCIQNRVPCMLQAGESLAAKRVVISTDGGRIRTRQYKEEKNLQQTHHKFDTPWKEPKLLVIAIIDQDGKISQKQLPIYDATFGEKALFNLLEEYLKSLNIREVEGVQIIADGALWIWNHAKDLLIDLGVSPEKITETVDYFHAVEHLKKITELMPKSKKNDKNKLFSELKTLLWEGKISNCVEKIKEQFKRIGKKVKTEINYFTKNEHRMNYQKFRETKWLCGSGIVESGVRRMINLRFKSPSCFWKQQNLDGLIFLRCALLSLRWKFVMHSLAKAQQ